MTLGQKLKQLRAQSKSTQEDIVKKLNSHGVTANRVTLSRWENDEQEPTLTPVMTLAKIYGVSADYLLGLTDDPQPIEVRAAANNGLNYKDLPQEDQEFIEKFILNKRIQLNEQQKKDNQN